MNANNNNSGGAAGSDAEGFLSFTMINYIIIALLFFMIGKNFDRIRENI